MFADQIMYLDGTGVLRNAGGRAAPALSDIVALHALMNLKNVIIIHHTGKSHYPRLDLHTKTDVFVDCGMSKITDAEIKKMEKETAPEAADEIDAMDYGTF